MSSFHHFYSLQNVSKCATILQQQSKDLGAPQFLALSAFGLFMVILPSPPSRVISKLSSTVEVLKFEHAAFDNTDLKRVLETDLDSIVTPKKRLSAVAESADAAAMAPVLNTA